MGYIRRKTKYSGVVSTALETLVETCKDHDQLVLKEKPSLKTSLSPQRMMDET